MNQEFPRFLKLSVADRVDVFEAEAERLDTLASYVGFAEKINKWHLI